MHAFFDHEDLVAKIETDGETYVIEVRQTDRKTKKEKEIKNRECHTHTHAPDCRVEELPLPTRAIQLSGEVLSTDEAASAELHEAKAVHWTRNSRCLFKAAPMTPCICREQQLETGVS